MWGSSSSGGAARAALAAFKGGAWSGVTGGGSPSVRGAPLPLPASQPGGGRRARLEEGGSDSTKGDCSCYDRTDSSVRRGMACGTDGTGTASGTSVKWEYVGGKCIDRFICEDEIKCDESLDAQAILDSYGPAGGTLLNSACTAAFGEHSCAVPGSVYLKYDDGGDTPRCRLWVSCQTWDRSKCGDPSMGDAPTVESTTLPDPIPETWEDGGSTKYPCLPDLDGVDGSGGLSGRGAILPWGAHTEFPRTEAPAVALGAFTNWHLPDPDLLKQCLDACAIGGASIINFCLTQAQEMTIIAPEAVVPYMAACENMTFLSAVACQGMCYEWYGDW